MPKLPQAPANPGRKASGVTLLPVRQKGTWPHTANDGPGLAALPDWDDMRVLLTVVNTGSFGRTAKALGLTQPTVSRRISRLERLVGARLVDRSNNGAVLTAEGQRVIEHLHIAHGAINRAVDRARSPLPQHEAVTVLTTDGLMTYWLPHFLPYLYDNHPGLELKTITASDTSVLERCKYDLMIHYMQPNDPNLMTVRLGTLHFMPFASPGYIQRHGRPRTPADLAEHRLLDYSLYLIDKGTWMTRLPAMAEQACARLFTNSSSALAEAVRKGAGIALLPTYGLVFEEGFVPLDLGLKFATPFWLCYRKEAMASETIRMVINFFKHIFNRRTMPWFADDFIDPDTFPMVTLRDLMATFPSPYSLAAVAG